MALLGVFENCLDPWQRNLQPFYHIKINLCFISTLLTVSVVLCEFAFALIWVSLKLAVLGTQFLIRWEILSEHTYITICVDSQLLLLLAEWKIMRKYLCHQCHLIVNKELYCSLCSCSLRISLYKGIEKVFMNE